MLGASEELLSIELLEEHARRLAALLSIAPEPRQRTRSPPATQRTHPGAARSLHRIGRRRAAWRPRLQRLNGCSTISTSSRRQRATSTMICRPHSSGGFPSSLPTSSPGSRRIYALALELIGSSAGRLEAHRLQRFISAFQSVTPLTMGELWAWPSALKLALLDHLRARGDVLAATRVHRVAADRAGHGDRVWIAAAPTSGRRTSIMRLSPVFCSVRARSDRSPRHSTAGSMRRWRRADRPLRMRSGQKDSIRRPNRPAWPT